VTRLRTLSACHASVDAEMMARPHHSYSERAEPRRFEGIDVTEPTLPGYYRARLVSGGVRGGVKIWFGAPLDPVTGEELDRSHRWQALFDGEYVDFDRVWPVCAGDPISEAEYRRYCGRKTWAEQNAPDSAYALRTRRLDPLSDNSPMPF
jgi:hypothetical protein